MLAYDKPYNEIRIEPAVIKESDTFTALVAKQIQRFICKKSWIIINNRCISHTKSRSPLFKATGCTSMRLPSSLWLKFDSFRYSKG